MQQRSKEKELFRASGIWFNTIKGYGGYRSKAGFVAVNRKFGSHE